MIHIVCETLLTIALIISIVTSRVERKDLLNRIMSRDYPEYKHYDEPQEKSKPVTPYQRVREEWNATRKGDK